MKILWICGSRILGGAERVTLQLATLLGARGHTVEALCRPDGAVAPAARCAGLMTHPAWLGGSLNVRAVAAIRRALNDVAPDVALVTTADEWVWACLARRPVQHGRLVLVRHMALPLNPWVRWLANGADAVVAVSQAVRQSLLGNLGVRPERIHVIYNPVRFSPRTTPPGPHERARARAALALPEGGRWVGFFGGLARAKGLRHVLSAVSRANVQLGATNLLVCGRSGDSGEPWSLVELQRAFALQGRVHHLGEIEHIDLALTAVDVVVLATHSALSEALPATLLEAMACGTPALGYATGGIVEAIGDHGEAGRLARADDVDDLSRQLIEMLTDAAAAQRMALAALSRARTLFDAQQAADRYDQLFSALRTQSRRDAT
ncbi:MAG TPA: glycosyltransferase family 4 protein [Candidatus Margulisiibacteriota bacterium]|nr:glycosyltransferase family 4 protein [Candidatus Margulisiibacteriota bacterium]